MSRPQNQLPQTAAERAAAFGGVPVAAAELAAPPTQAGVQQDPAAGGAPTPVIRPNQIQTGNAALDFVLNQGPRLTGMGIGAILGAPGGPPGMFIGGAAGGATMEGLRQGALWLGGERPQPEQIPEAAMEGGFGELFGAGVSRALRPVAGWLQRSGLRNLFKLTGSQSEEVVAEATLPEALERMTGFTPRLAPRMDRGLRATVEEARERSGKAVGDFFDALPEDVVIDKQDLLDALFKARRSAMVEGGVTGGQSVGLIDVTPQKALTGAMDDLIDIVQEFGDDISPQSIRKTRQIWDRILDSTGLFDKPRGGGVSDVMGDVAASRQWGLDQATLAIRHELDKQFPDLTKLNAEFAFWRRFEDLIKDAGIGGKAARPQMVTRKDIMVVGTATGAAAQKLGIPRASPLAIVGLDRLFESGLWATTSAATKKQMADLIAGGQVSRAAALVAQISAPSREPFTRTQQRRNRARQ